MTRCLALILSWQGIHLRFGLLKLQPLSRHFWTLPALSHLDFCVAWVCLQQPWQLSCVHNPWSDVCCQREAPSAFRALNPSSSLSVRPASARIVRKVADTGRSLMRCHPEQFPNGTRQPLTARVNTSQVAQSQGKRSEQEGAWIFEARDQASHLAGRLLVSPSGGEVGRPRGPNGCRRVLSSDLQPSGGPTRDFGPSDPGCPSFVHGAPTVAIGSSGLMRRGPASSTRVTE